MRANLLKIIAAAAFGALCFPPLIWLDTNSFGNISVFRILFYFLISMAAFGLGCLVTAIVKNVGVKEKKRAALRIISRIFGGALFFAGAFSLMIEGDAATFIALGGSCTLFYFIGERFMYKNFSDMFPLSAFAFYLVCSLSCYLFVRVGTDERIRDDVSGLILTAFCAEIVAAALLVNQSGIFVKANMRKETRTSLPKGLTGYNAALVLALSAAGLGLTVFRGSLAWLLKQIIIIIVRCFLFIISLFSAENFDLEPGESGGISGGYAPPNVNPVWEVVSVIVVITAIVVFRKKIFSLIKGFFEYLGSLLGGKPEESEDAGFIDRFENYSGGRRKRDLPVSYYALSVMYKTETDSVKKFRLGYRLLLYKIRSYNHALRPSDTTSEQVRRGGNYIDSELLSAVAGDYDGIRYGGETATKEQLARLDVLIK